MRLFIALHFSAPFKAALCRGMDALRQQGRGNFTREENLHLTLAFLGECESAKPAIRALKQVQAPTFSLTLDRLGRFGDLYWAGVRREGKLMDLQKQVSQALAEAGFSLEERKFKPHLTLCRQFLPYSTVDIEAVRQAMGNPQCRIEKISLMQSSRIGGKLVYTELFSQQLEK